jgi:hypothetical protein
MVIPTRLALEAALAVAEPLIAHPEFLHLHLPVVLITSEGAPRSFLGNVVIGCNETPDAARSVSAPIPLLMRAKGYMTSLRASWHGMDLCRSAGRLSRSSPDGRGILLHSSSSRGRPYDHGWLRALVCTRGNVWWLHAERAWSSGNACLFVALMT